MQNFAGNMLVLCRIAIKPEPKRPVTLERAARTELVVERRGGWPSLSFLNHGSQHTPGGCPILVAVLWRQGGALPTSPDAQWQAHPFAPPRRPFRFDLNDPF